VTEDTLEPMKFLPARERVLTCFIITHVAQKEISKGEYTFTNLFCKMDRNFPVRVRRTCRSETKKGHVFLRSLKEPTSGPSRI
jgi:hypothetical protein